MSPPSKEPGMESKGKSDSIGESKKLTRQQNDLCYEIKFGFMRAIMNISNEELFKIVEQATYSIGYEDGVKAYKAHMDLAREEEDEEEK